MNINLYSDQFDLILCRITDIFPEAQIELDNDGQLIIYTGVFEESSPAT
jgi:hypothetical protein